MLFEAFFRSANIGIRSPESIVFVIIHRHASYALFAILATIIRLDYLRSVVQHAAECSREAQSLQYTHPVSPSISARRSTAKSGSFPRGDASNFLVDRQFASLEKQR